MDDLSEFVSDYLQAAKEAGERRPKAKDIAEAYLDQNLEDDQDFDTEVKLLTPQIRYYLP